MERVRPLKPGQVFYGPMKTLTDAHFLLFSGVTGDTHPIHYDVEYAARTRFATPVAHGLLLASLTAFGATVGGSTVADLIFIEQGCRFLRPVCVGDTITPKLVVESLWNEGKRKFVKLTTTLINQRGETALQGFHVYQHVRRSEVQTS
jgi:acyl dehydratase